MTWHSNRPVLGYYLACETQISIPVDANDMPQPKYSYQAMRGTKPSWFQTDQRPAASAPARCLPLDETTDDGAVAHTTKPGSKTKKAAFMTAKIGLERHLRQAVRALIPAHIA